MGPEKSGALQWQAQLLPQALALAAGVLSLLLALSAAAAGAVAVVPPVPLVLPRKSVAYQPEPLS